MISAPPPPLGDRGKGQKIVNGFSDAGVTWWFEWLDNGEAPLPRCMNTYEPDHQKWADLTFDLTVRAAMGRISA